MKIQKITNVVGDEVNKKYPELAGMADRIEERQIDNLPFNFLKKIQNELPEGWRITNTYLIIEVISPDNSHTLEIHAKQPVAL